MTALVARTVPLERDVDLSDVAGADGFLFARGGHGLAGRGEAARVLARDAAGALAAIATVDDVGGPGTGPVAFGALGFDRPMAAEMVVPALVVGRAEDGRRWATHVGPPGEAFPAPVAPAFAPAPGAGRLSAPAPAAYIVRSTRDPEDWCRAVASARDRIRAGDLEKVVLAREVVVEADAPFDRAALARRLRELFPSAYVYAVGGFVGASPELLVARSGEAVSAHPLAGTAPRSNDPARDARLAADLIASTKDRREHRITVDYVHDHLLAFCSYLDEEAEPSIVAVANVQHLGTLLEGRLSAPAAHALELVEALHPTPAVGGFPLDAALALVEALEGLERGPYAGPVGWVDAAGNGRFAVGIRGAQVEGNRARLLAGVGVVADSDPAAELAETRAKLQAMLGALVRP